VCEAVESPSIARDPTLGQGEEELDAPIWNPDLAFRKRTVRYTPGTLIPDIREWLVQRGYLLGDESDLDGLSERTPFGETVEIYDKIDKKYRPKDLTPREHD
jgi:hypothetical protein